MKTLYLSIIVILFVSVFANIEHAFANIGSTPHLNVTTTDYGGNGIMVNSNQTVTPFLPSPPLGMYPYASKIFSVFQIDPEIVHPNGTSSIHILVTNNANFTLYDVNLGESVNDSRSMLFSNIHQIDILNPNQTKTIYGTLHVSADVQPTDYYDIWWNVVAKNQTGNMMESMQFHRNLPVTQNLPQYYTDTTVITLESPLKQFKSGMEAKDVQCNNGLSLVIKAEDNSPACVTSQTAQKLVERGWGMISNLTFTNNNPKNNCGRFYTAPANQDDFKSIPVLLMNSNSTACAKLTFTIVSDYKDCNGKTCQAVSRLDSIIHIGNVHNTKYGNGFSITPERDYTNSFKITAIPETIDLANYPIGSNFTVIYIIHSLPNATGFYDQSLPRPVCEHYPLAVGYSVDEVNASDFSFLLYHPPCASEEYQLTGVEISGMIYKQVVLP